MTIRWAALVLCGMLVALCGCGDRERIDLEVQEAGGELVLTLHGMDGVVLTLLAGRPWGGDDPIPAGGSLVMPPWARLLARSIPAGETFKRRLRASELRDFPDPWALQAVANRPGDESHTVASSQAWLVRSTGSTLEPRTLQSHLLVSEGGLLLLGVAAPLLIACGLSRLRWPSRWRPRWGLTLVGAALAALVLGRAWAAPQREAVEQGWVAPPLIWPWGWGLDDEPFVRTLGPDLQRLVDSAGSARQSGESLVIWTSTAHDALRRATYLAYLLRVEARVRGPDSRPSGLCIFVGLEPTGTTLFDSDAGVLARLGGP